MLCPHCRKEVFDEEGKLPFIKIIDYMKEVSAKKWRTVPSTRKLMNARWKEGYALDDFKYVIENQWAIWSGTKDEKYFSPATLFAPSKFEGYVNAPAHKAEHSMIADIVKKETGGNQ